jgi:hypothetical protein
VAIAKNANRAIMVLHFVSEAFLGFIFSISP